MIRVFKLRSANVDEKGKLMDGGVNVVVLQDDIALAYETLDNDGYEVTGTQFVPIDAGHPSWGYVGFFTCRLKN